MNDLCFSLLFSLTIALAIKGMYVQAIINFILWIIATILTLTGILAIIGIPLWIICVVWAWISIAQRANEQKRQEIIGNNE